MPASSVTQTIKKYALVSAAALGVVAVLWSVNHGVVGAQPSAVATPVSPQPVLQSAPVEVRGLPDFTILVDRVGPAVVNIRAIERVRPDTPRGATPDEQMLEFFRRFGIPVPPGMAPPRNQPSPGQGPDIERPRGVGSGFILSPDGFIMTNAHVVEGADRVVVTLPDQREFTAQIVGSDRRTDVAVVKIDAIGLPVVRIGDVNRLRVGEWVMAIGSPFGLENTVTAGIVSAKQRDTGDFLPFIQTDVAINPGNSGGPLINMRGEVVGINSQIYSRSGGFQGISFAIPIDEAVRVSDQLRATGTVTRGRLGVAIDAITRELAESMGLPRAEGALVRGVENNSPAAQGGIQPGDVILSFNGTRIERSADLPRAVANTAPGSRATVRVWRQGTERELTVTVGTFGEERVARAPGAPEPEAKPSKASELLGLSVRELTAAERRDLKVESGVFVVQAQGPAARAGLREQDVIVGMGNRPLANLRDFEAAVSGIAGDRPVSVLIRRGDWVQYALIRPGGR